MPSLPLTPGERLIALADAEFRRLARELAAARAGKDGAVHRSRKTIQRLRALVRLQAPASPAWARRENASLRRLRRRLGRLRDAAVRLELVQALSQRELVEGERVRLDDAIARLRQQLREEWVRYPSESAFWEQLQAVTTRLHARLPKWPAHSLDAKSCRRALEHQRRRLRESLREALGSTGRTRRHQLRCRLRRYAALRKAAAHVLRHRDPGAAKLTEHARALGVEGDLWLSATAIRRLGHASATRHLRSLLERERRALCKRHDGELVAVRRRLLQRPPKPARARPAPAKSAAAVPAPT